MDNNQKALEQLIEKIKQGDEKAYQVFYEQWYPKVYYIALSITHHEADAKDAAQETMIEIYKSIYQLRDLKYFKLWVNRIVLSKCNRIFRKRNALTMNEMQQNMLEHKQENRADFMPDKMLRQKSDQELLQYFIRKLPLIYSETLALMYFQQCSIKEIAQILAIPEGTVKSRINAAKGKLKHEIDLYEKQEGVKLDFHGNTLEAVLASFYLEQFPKVSLIKSGKPIKNPVSSFLKVMTSNVSMLGVGTVLCGSLVLGTLTYSSQNDTAIQDNVYSIQSLEQFTAIRFREFEVKSEKDAYFVLMQYAHCEKELEELSEEERITITSLKNQLVDKNGVYGKLLK